MVLTPLADVFPNVVARYGRAEMDVSGLPAVVDRIRGWVLLFEAQIGAVDEVLKKGLSATGALNSFEETKFDKD